MPVKLPGPSESLPVPRASGRIVTAPVDPRGAALAGLGRDVGRAGDELYQAFEEESRRINKVRTEDAFTELRNAQIDLSIGEENGFQGLKSGDAVKRPVLKEWTGKFDETAESISSGLQNEEQKSAFKLRADAARSQFSQDILQHLGRENTVYQTQVMDSTVDAERNASSMHWNSPGDVMASLERVKMAVNSYADANGLTGDVKEGAYIKRASKVHAEVIGQAMNNGNPEYAELWFKTHRKEIDADTAAAAERVMKQGGDRIRAQRAADSIMEMGLPEDEAKKHARKNYTGEERDDVIRRVEGRYNDIADAVAQQQKQSEDSAWKIVVQPQSSIDSIPPTLWASMSGEAQKQVTTYLRTRDTKEKQEDDWAMLDEIEGQIAVGDITDPSQLIRYEPFFKDSTFRSLRKKVEKRGTVSATVVQRSFEDRIGKTRSKWKDEDRKQWMAYQGYILDNVSETKRPEDVDVWADRWFMEGYGSEDRLFRDDPDTFGEAHTKGRKDFIIKTPDDASTEVSASLEMLRGAGVTVPEGDEAVDEFYTTHYLDASRWFAARDIMQTPDRVAAYSVLKSQNKPVTAANIDYIAGQLK
jgi:hypothetical protein